MSSHFKRKLSSVPPKHRQSRTNPEPIISLIHSAKSLLHLKQIHSHLLRRHRLSGAAHHLISACSPLRSIPYALSLFHHHLLPPSPPLFTALLRALSDSHHHHLSLSHFSLMLSLGLPPSRLSLPFALRSAASLPSAAALHALALKPALHLDPFVRTSLAHAYLRLHSPSLALQLLYETPHSHLLSNPLLFNIAITASSDSGDMITARHLFLSMPARTPASWNSLIHGFMRNGDPCSAAELFDRMPDKNVVSWTTMVSGLANNGDARQAVGMFETMLDAGVRPNSFTVSSALSACAKIGALEAGIRIHDYVRKNRFREDGAVGTALVDMYSKCGKIDVARRVFDGMTERDLSAWTAMIMGFAIHGRWADALRCFADMKRSLAEPPDEGAFLAVLMACSHSGRVEQGLEVFYSMQREYRVEPTVKHYTCVVDLLGRAGRLDECLGILNTMQVEPDYVLWGAFFCACRAHKNVRLAEFAAEKLLKLNPMHSGSYVFLSNVYSAAGRWEDAERVRVHMRDCRVQKSPGWSHIEIGGRSHYFVAGDHSHPRSDEIYRKLEEMVTRARELGYRPSTELVLHNVEEEDKEDSLGWHSEKLALGLGLVSCANGEEIRIMKNLRVCGDCHSLMKHVSRIYGRSIMLRDNKRFHLFKDGHCSCGDYW